MTQTEFRFDVKEPDISTLNGTVLDVLQRGGWWMPYTPPASASSLIHGPQSPALKM